ncbi:hypothetical protein [Cohnella sp. WQ 127256]|uniref:hypothetical protein n=1 Tax=Cohnella sp. WQ 127256 TaxID=2938790 RepID=UPI0027411AA0|nr:hypothetical protein [Cohnella sp. WQ 127256]
MNTQTGGPGTGLGEFNSPQAVAVDTAGNVYVADTDNNRIQMFVASVGMHRDGNLYVADTFKHRVLGRELLMNASTLWTDVPEKHWAYGAIQAATLDHSADEGTD